MKKGAAKSLFSLLLAIVVLAGTAAFWVRHEMRAGLISQAVDQGACASSSHVYLKHPVAGDNRAIATRELIRGTPACMKQIEAMLAANQYFDCHKSLEGAVCERQLNTDPEDSSETRLVISKGEALLDNVPS